MAPRTDEQLELHVRLQTFDGKVEGRLRMSAVLRMLDAINMDGRRFITLHAPTTSESGWSFGNDAVAVNKDAVLFAVQCDEHDRPGPRGAPSVFFPAQVRLRVKQFSIQGCLHVAAEGSPMKWLNGYPHEFVALTSATLSGPGVDLQVPFVAVNRKYITAAQEGEPVERELAGSTAGTATAE